MATSTIQPDPNTFRHQALEHPRRAIRLCKFVSKFNGLSPPIELEIAHYTLDNVADFDYADDDGVVFANFEEDDQVASFQDAEGHRQRVRYTAVSYCWGDGPSTRIISLNGKIFLVSQNLYDLLSVLHDGPGNQNLFWIDQLCIDQLDVDERNNQVNLMSFIYSSAEAVYAWLGLATPTTTSGLRMLERLEVSIATLERQDSSARTHTMTDESEASFLAAADLLTREYWTRLWIVQEVIYARKLFLLCGPYRYFFGEGKKEIDYRPWENQILRALVTEIDGVAGSKSRSRKVADRFDTSFVLRQTLALLNHHLFMLDCREKQSVGYILSFDAVADHGWRQCRDPCDRVFALQALVAPSHRVRVDYKKSPVSVFHEWAEETDTRRRHIAPNPEYVRSAITSLYSSMGLGEITEQQLGKIMYIPKVPQQAEHGVKSSAKPQISRKTWVQEHPWHGVSVIALLVSLFWLFLTTT
ncbi:hypothetical protein FKW77_009963 [Venturia effusa]|uniref:Heterokaryon incompatibility domain-containing protein n=1 Tax=Venturia effusa TaxID=50376 RepID=A0A517L6B4_9PEZI|nr:hypothetical protein FKW77_009963 [Venturia effusa]